MVNVKVVFATESQTDRQTDKTKTRCPRIPFRGQKKNEMHES